MLRVSSPMPRVRNFAFVAPLLSLAAHAAVVGVAALQVGAHAQGVAASARAAPMLEVPAPDVVAEPFAEPAPEPQVTPSTRVEAARPAAPVTVARAAAPTESQPVALDPLMAVVPATADSSAPHFVVALSALTVASGVATATAGLRPGSGGGDAPVSAAAADTPAKLLFGSPPSYTAAAQAAGVEADVALEIIVGDSGALQSARSVAHVGYGLDEAAVNAVKNYRFSPARLAGRAIAVRMRWLMRFQLR